MPSDIDFMVERNNMFLVIEFKPENKPLSMGQSIMLKRMSKIQHFVVAVIWHKSCGLHEHKTPISMQILPNGNKIDADTNSVRMFVKDWWNTANSVNRR